MSNEQEQHWEIRRLSERDIPAAMRLKSLAGWNQTEQDWQRLLDHDPAGCLAAWVGERLAGTVTSTSYGTELAWIGMVLVDPELRRRGIATALLHAVLNHLHGIKVRTIKLDATAAGRGVYAALGFVEESLIERWEGSAQPLPATSSCRALRDDDWPALLALDRSAFGADRTRILASLRDADETALVCPQEGTLRGFVLARPGATQAYLGPLVAVDEAAAQALLDAKLAQLAGQSVFVDLNASHAPGAQWLTARGFVKRRELLRMRAGQPSAAGTTPQILAIAGLEIG
jgi:ribosomal protein S18 acetylase RimI-like enzyme